MRRIFILLIILLFLTIFYYIGGFYYLNYLRYMIFSPQAQREKILHSLDRTIYGETAIVGVYMNRPLNRLLVWNNEGIKVFIVNDETVVSYFDGCAKDILGKDLSREPNFEIYRKRYLGLDNLLSNEGKKIGGYVVKIGLPSEADASSNVLVKELWIYNWWEFINGDMKKKCGL